MVIQCIASISATCTLFTKKMSALNVAIICPFNRRGLGGMSPCVEFGRTRSGLRKNKASLGWMRARRAQRHTRVCASAENPQAAQDRRRLCRTEFEHIVRNKTSLCQTNTHQSKSFWMRAPVAGASLSAHPWRSRMRTSKLTCSTADSICLWRRCAKGRLRFPMYSRRALRSSGALIISKEARHIQYQA